MKKPIILSIMLLGFILFSGCGAPNPGQDKTVSKSENETKSQLQVVTSSQQVGSDANAESSGSVDTPDTFADNHSDGISLTYYDGALIYGDSFGSIRVRIPSIDKFFVCLPPVWDRMELYVIEDDGSKTPLEDRDPFLRSLTLYYPFEGQPLTRNKIEICACAFNTLDFDDSDGEESIVVGNDEYNVYVKTRATADGIEICAHRSSDVSYINIELSKEAYSELEEIIQDILKGIEEYHMN